MNKFAMYAVILVGIMHVKIGAGNFDYKGMSYYWKEDHTLIQKEGLICKVGNDAQYNVMLKDPSAATSTDPETNKVLYNTAGRVAVHLKSPHLIPESNKINISLYIGAVEKERDSLEKASSWWKRLSQIAGSGTILCGGMACVMVRSPQSNMTAKEAAGLGVAFFGCGIATLAGYWFCNKRKKAADLVGEEIEGLKQDETQQLLQSVNCAVQGAEVTQKPGLNQWAAGKILDVKSQFLKNEANSHGFDSRFRQRLFRAKALEGYARRRCYTSTEF